VREPVTTAECNQCHNPLAIHGGGRREISLCQLCHTRQLSGGEGEFRVMVHKIHRGKNLPSIASGAVGDTYEFGGHEYAKKVGRASAAPAACPARRTRLSVGHLRRDDRKGVGFPKDLRRCDTCHKEARPRRTTRPTPGPVRVMHATTT
jgi:OmcA/MtrC family decaheme c-type cytochrome